MNRRNVFTLVAVCSFGSWTAAYAEDSPAFPQVSSSGSGPGIIAIGSPMVWHPLNAPDTFSANVTFSSTPVTVDNGAVSLWQQQVPTGSNGEWDVFYMKTTNGGPIAGNVSANWNITMDYTLTAPAFFDQVVQQWVMNGTPVGPLTNGIGSIWLVRFCVEPNPFGLVLLQLGLHCPVSRRTVYELAANICESV